MSSAHADDRTPLTVVIHYLRPSGPSRVLGTVTVTLRRLRRTWKQNGAYMVPVQKQDSALEKNPRYPIGITGICWLREHDLNLRPSDYEFEFMDLKSRTYPLSPCHPSRCCLDLPLCHMRITERHAHLAVTEKPRDHRKRNALENSL